MPARGADSSPLTGPGAPGSGLIVLGAEPAVEPLGVEVEDRLPKGRLVEDALEHVLVFVHPPHNGVEERAVEDEPADRRLAQWDTQGARMAAKLIRPPDRPRHSTGLGEDRVRNLPALGWQVLARVAPYVFVPEIECGFAL